MEEGRLDEVAAALGDVAGAHARFTLAISGLGAFPTPSRPRVLWAGVAAGADRIAALAGAVDTALARLGFPSEARPFSAHVTLGRVRDPRRDPEVEQSLRAAAARPFGSVAVEEIVLMRSQLSPRGARYTPLAAALRKG